MSRTLGIVGGIAPPSTIDCYGQLTTRFRALSPDGAYPSLLIDSINATAFFALLASGDRGRLAEFLLAEVRRLARGGADGALFASNTPHLVFDEVERDSPIPLISIVGAAADVGASRGYRKLGLLGVRFTLEGGFYQRKFAARGMTVSIPTDEDRAYVHDRYFAELVEGRFLDETRAGISKGHRSHAHRARDRGGDPRRNRAAAPLSRRRSAEPASSGHHQHPRGKGRRLTPRLERRDIR